MPIVGKPGEYGHNDPNRAFVDSDYVRGGIRSKLTSLAELYALAPKWDQLKEYSSMVYVKDAVNGIASFYLLIDATNIANANGWEPYKPGGDVDITIDTATDLGGETSSDDKISSQKAIKTFVETKISASISSIMKLQGDWNAATNTPDISATTETGYSWRVSTVGTTAIGGITDWSIGDMVVKTETSWMKIAGNDLDALWGNISGSIDDQEDLKAIIDAINLAIAAKATDLVDGDAVGLYMREMKADGTIVWRKATDGDEYIGEVLQMKLSSGKTFGRYSGTGTIDATTLTAAQLIKQAIYEAAAPTITLSKTGGNISFGSTGKTVTLGLNAVSNEDGVISNRKLEYKIGSGEWIELPITWVDGVMTYTHANITGTDNRFYVPTLYYRYSLTDSKYGNYTSSTLSVYFEQYATPTLGITIAANTLNAGDYDDARGRGNVASTLAVSATTRRSNVKIQGWELYRSVDGAAYVHVISGGVLKYPTAESSLDANMSVTDIAQAATVDIPLDATTVSYRLSVVDDYRVYQDSNLGIKDSTTSSLSFHNVALFGYSGGSAINEALVQSLAKITDTLGASNGEISLDVDNVFGNVPIYAVPADLDVLTGFKLKGVEGIASLWEVTPMTLVINGVDVAYKVYTSASGTYGDGDYVDFTVDGASYTGDRYTLNNGAIEKV